MGELEDSVSEARLGGGERWEIRLVRWTDYVGS